MDVWNLGIFLFSGHVLYMVPPPGKHKMIIPYVMIDIISAVRVESVGPRMHLLTVGWGWKPFVVVVIDNYIITQKLPSGKLLLGLCGRSREGSSWSCYAVEIPLRFGMGGGLNIGCGGTDSRRRSWGMFLDWAVW